MTSKYTAAPWVNDDGLVNGRESRARFAPGVSIDIFDASEWPADMHDEALANAALISAAPDLLIALRNLLVIAGTPITSRQEEVLAAARASIAKAEGRTP